MTTKMPLVKTEERRKLFHDPEFPFWTDKPEIGHVFLYIGEACVVCDIKDSIIYFRELNEDNTDSPLIYRTQVSKIEDLTNGGKLKIIDRMYYHGDGKPFQLDPIDYSSISVHPKQDHSDILPPENPLREFPYWNGPGGKNLTIIACLEWALTHLKFAQKELPCVENEISITALDKAISLQKRRQELRREQGLLGTKKDHISDTYTVLESRYEDEKKKYLNKISTEFLKPPFPSQD